MAQISERLRRALESDDACLLTDVVKAGRQEDFEALQSLLSLDPSINPGHRRKAIYALGRWGDSAAVSDIRSLLPHLDEAGRISAIGALGRLGTEAALEGVLEHATDPSPHVRKFAARALGRIDTPEARKKLKEIKAKDEMEYVRTVASKQLRPEEETGED